ncbi:hypothetical protein A3I34_01345 [Candidatus Jorgensenbacteria bacterium RIFCSPLOWO2_02_FULL_45_12]|uniref:Uncharacterized protein n=2 Tax=Candidatus Joergenseniibacteriota TaxID=1752739 RepID=A0A1F6BN00_9BACT|nr:MAG: Glycosyl transferase group 1 [Candidatus Jorgensenbacteria bacterium GW2011_GWA2_45_9]OGG38291.1 MAG: hypothetical protein A3D55_02020 [Candidatus Jorgensenbacteria bacterium RIFCSPHIGHO2_02_FULL_45_20]OGG42673.1 MAG: hypothetical protein A3I34_01345 [Candidatus Jorgensenbacteria bacterium RIFCSPLOWO2_02_FULL_45_12]
MKILHIIPSYLPAVVASGPILPTHFLNEELVKMGHSVAVCATNLDGGKVLDVPLKNPVLIDGVKVNYFPSKFLKRWYFSAEMAAFLREEMNSFDITHITSVFLFQSFIGARYAKRFRKPYIISPHGNFMKEPLEMKSRLRKKIYISLVEKKILAGAAAVHFTAEKEKEEYIAADMPARKAIVIPNSYKAETYTEKKDIRRKFGIPADKKIIIQIGRIGWKKGFDTLIPAFAEVLFKEPKAALVIAGGDDGGYKKEVLNLIEKYGLRAGENVFFVGMVLEADKYSLLKESAVFTLPSYSENFGMVVVESLAHGVPVVISTGVGISSRIEKEGAGIVVPKDARALAEAILRVLGNRVLATELSRKGIEFVNKYYRPREVAKNFSLVYEELAAAPRKPENGV